MRKFFAQILFCVVAISSTAFGQVIANGLIGHWSGNNTTADSSSGGNNGTFVAQSASYGTGVFGQAFNINGGYVAVPDSNAWTFAGDFTITLWANASSVSGAFVSHDQGGGSLPKWIFWNTGSNALGFHVNGPEGSANIDTGASSLTDNRWYHLAITRSGNQFTLYIDGSAVTGATNSIVFENANASLIFGQAEGGFQFTGLLDEIAIYNRALSSGEILSVSSAIPEPADFALWGSAAALLVGLFRRQRQSAAGVSATSSPTD